MDMKLREFRKQAGEENRGRRGLGRRYSGQLRLAAVAYLRGVVAPLLAEREIYLWWWPR